ARFAFRTALGSHEAQRIYRSNFPASAVLDKPYAMIGARCCTYHEERPEVLATTAFQRWR
ncbi:hypothetical protein P4133_00105, partial [Pseudomonas aeruginosa]|nr:hypothetical protein [Pseudomonas aeruginosa]